MTSLLSESFKEPHNIYTSFYNLINACVRDKQKACDIYDRVLSNDMDKRVCHIKQHLMHLRCEPAINAIIRWSKIKFNVINLEGVSQELRNTLLLYVRKIESELENGLIVHFGNAKDVVCTKSYDDYCQFTLECVVHPSHCGGLV